MKPFDIELAKAGHPVQTRDGKKVRILCYDADSKDYPIVGLIETERLVEPFLYSTEGKVRCCNVNLDLVMAPIKKEGWINIYTGVNGEFVSGSVFKRETDALNNVIKEFDYITTKKIELEE